MGWLTDVDWDSVLTPGMPVLEIALRGTIVYLALFLILRVILKREAGTVGLSDLLVVVLLADAAQNAMADDYQSLPDGILLVTVIVLWAYALDALSYRFPSFERFVKPPALPLVRDGQLIRHNMRKQYVTEEELMSQVRLQGIDDISDVEHAYVESDGRISVIAPGSDCQGAKQRRTR